MAPIDGTNGNDNNTFAGFFDFRPALIGSIDLSLSPPFVDSDIDDVINGKAKNDILVGLGGNDILDGGTDADIMFGGSGDDTYYVDNTGDKVGEASAGGGMDSVISSVDYSLNTGPFYLPAINGLVNNGAALATLGAAKYAAYLFLSEPPTRPELTPTFIENLTLTGTAIIGEGNDLDNIIDGNGENNVLSGLGGNDTIRGLGGNDTISAGEGNDLLNGNMGDDSLNGNVGDDTVRGGQGNDIVRGGQGNDSLYGDLGNDSVFGDLGNDTLYGGEGNDILDGGVGIDTADYGTVQDPVVPPRSITLKGAGIPADFDLTVEKGPLGSLGIDTLLNIEEVIADGTVDNNTINFSGALGGIKIDVNLDTQILTTIGVTDSTFSLAKVVNFDDVIGTDNADKIEGDQFANILDGGKGNDTIKGRQGNDTIYGGYGDDDIEGNSGNDTIYGGKGNDSIIGGVGNDFISGGAGKDILTGGNNNPAADGGNNLFDYTNLTDSRLSFSWFTPNLSGVDVITDFNVAKDKFFVTDVPSDGILPGVRQLSTNSIFGLVGTVLGLATLGQYDAAQITVGSGLGARTFVAINDGSFGFNASKDAFIELTNFTGTLTTDNFTNILPV
jgi:Ca2+-binding RTX toxin-like protein